MRILPGATPRAVKTSSRGNVRDTHLIHPIGAPSFFPHGKCITAAKPLPEIASNKVLCLDNDVHFLFIFLGKGKIIWTKHAWGKGCVSSQEGTEYTLRLELLRFAHMKFLIINYQSNIINLHNLLRHHHRRRRDHHDPQMILKICIRNGSTKSVKRLSNRQGQIQQKLSQSNGAINLCGDDVAHLSMLFLLRKFETMWHDVNMYQNHTDGGRCCSWCSHLKKP